MGKKKIFSNVRCSLNNEFVSKFISAYLSIRPLSIMNLGGVKMKESPSKHNSLQQYLNDRRIAETKATGVAQEIKRQKQICAQKLGMHQNNKIALRNV